METRARIAGWAAAALLGAVALGSAEAAPPGQTGAKPVAIAPRTDVNLAELTRETQKQIQTGRHVTLVWWVPEQFWSTALKQNGSPLPIIEGAKDAFRPYLVFFVLDGEADPTTGAMTFESEAHLRERLQVRDAQGKSHAPLDWAKVNPETANLLSTLKPILAKSAGSVGSSLYPLVFSVNGSDGKPIAEPLTPGQLTVQLGADSFGWDLPLASLVMDRVCPVDGKKFNGTYRFCPYHGVELRAQ